MSHAGIAAESSLGYYVSSQRGSGQSETYADVTVCLFSVQFCAFMVHMGVTGEGFPRDYALDQRGSGQPHKGVQTLASLCSVSYLSTREKDSGQRGSGQTHRGGELQIVFI